MQRALDALENPDGVRITSGSATYLRADVIAELRAALDAPVAPAEPTQDATPYHSIAEAAWVLHGYRQGMPECVAFDLGAKFGDRRLAAPVAPAEPVAQPQKYTDDPRQTGVGLWCAPGPAAEQARLFVLRFEDQDRGEAHYTDEPEARTAFARAEARGWNCHLFAHVERASPAAPVAQPLTEGTAAYHLAELTKALNGAFISSWQSTAAWQKQLDDATEYLQAAGQKGGAV